MDRAEYRYRLAGKGSFPDLNTGYAAGGGGGMAYVCKSIDGGNFILHKGNTWTASSGAKLQVRCIKDGASTFKFIELSRL